MRGLALVLKKTCYVGGINAEIVHSVVWIAIASALKLAIDAVEAWPSLCCTIRNAPENLDHPPKTKKTKKVGLEKW